MHVGRVFESFSDHRITKSGLQEGTAQSSTWDKTPTDTPKIQCGMI